MLCPICNLEKPAEDFEKRRRSERSGCKACRRLQYHQKWYEDNKDKIRAERRAKFGAEGSHTDEQWQALLNETGRRCQACGCDTCELTEDHIVPLSRGGSDWISNIQPLCERCNRLKADKAVVYRDGEAVNINVPQRKLPRR